MCIFKTTRWVVFLAIGLTVCTLPASLKAVPITTNNSILFLGFAADAYEDCFKEICSNDPTVSSFNLTTASYVSLGFGPLDQFYAGRHAPGISNTLLAELDKAYDYIVYIPKEFHAQFQPEIYMEAARTLRSYTRDMGSQVVLPMIWASSDAVSNTNIFEEHAYRIGDALGLDCVPAGLSWAAVLQDSSINVSDSDPRNPSSAAEYTLAATLYAFFFEQAASNTTYAHGLTADEKSSIITNSYNAWDTARTAIHYTGAYTNSFCTPWAVAHDFNNRNSAAVGTSTENGTHKKLKVISSRAGYNANTELINGYHYNGDDYFDGILTATPNPGVTPIPDLLATNNYNFLFGRIEGTKTDWSSGMTTLHSHDPGADLNFIFFNKHDSKNAYSTRTHIVRGSYYAIASSRHAHIQGIPNFMGFARAWQDRPDLILIPWNNQHLTSEGVYLQAAMIYTLVSGGQHPKGNYTGWSNNELYVLNLAYAMVNELGGLTNIVTEPIATDTSYQTDSDTAIEIHFSGIDLDDLPLSVNIVSGPNKGSLSGTGATRIYTPDSASSGTDRITFKLNNGTYDSAKGTITIDVQPTDALAVITTQPSDVTINIGTSTNLNVVASGQNLTYQWYEGTSGDTSTPLSGATSSSYTTPILNDTTSYWVRITNGAGDVDSDTATVTVSDFADTDADGIDDSWETTYFASTDATDGTGDADGDGSTDFFEYLYGSNPTNAASSGFGLSVQMHNDGTSVVCDWSVRERFVVGQDYKATLSSDLASWTTLPSGQYSLITTTNGGMVTLEIIFPEAFGPRAFFKFTKP